jgi:pSer/pThr/pTyr-binding forkhead associated (FHA) protein
VTVRDLDSANGTEVERDNVVTKVAPGEERELAAGDKIRIGEFTVVIISSINL